MRPNGQVALGATTDHPPPTFHPFPLITFYSSLSPLPVCCKGTDGPYNAPFKSSHIGPAGTSAALSGRSTCMAEEHGGQTRDTAPLWTKLFSGFRIAILPSKLLLAGAGLLSMAAGW